MIIVYFVCVCVLYVSKLFTWRFFVYTILELCILFKFCFPCVLFICNRLLLSPTEALHQIYICTFNTNANLKCNLDFFEARETILHWNVNFTHEQSKVIASCSLWVAGKITNYMETFDDVFTNTLCSRNTKYSMDLTNTFQITTFYYSFMLSYSN